MSGMRTRTDIDELSAQKQKEYVKNWGTRCPFCGSQHLDGGNVEIDAGAAYQDITCTECRKEWTDSYKLVGMI